MDPVWLLIPAAVGLFALRTVMIALKLKRAAQDPSVADLRAVRDAKRSLQAHRDNLKQAVSSPKEHLAAAKQLARVPAPSSPSRLTGLDGMVEEYLPDRRS